MGMIPDVDPTKAGYLLPERGNRTLADIALVNAKVDIPILYVASYAF